MSQHPRGLIGLARGKPEFVERFNASCLRTQEAENLWIAELRARDVQAAHPDDGWIDDKTITLALVYPQFNDGAKQGDLIALGTPENYRLVRLVKYLTDLSERWQFEVEKI